MNRKTMVDDMRVMLMNMNTLLNRAGIVMYYPYQWSEKLTTKFVKDGHTCFVAFMVINLQRL